MYPSSPFPPRRRPLALAVAGFFGLVSAPAAMATNHVVGSCVDDGSPETLRSVISAATTASGDTVDLSGLDCPASKITLADGADHIVVPQTSLTIMGPAASTLTIDGSLLAQGVYYNYSNILSHTGNGTLTISHLTLSGGHQKNRVIDALGGCIYSKADVDLQFVTVSSCTTYSEYDFGKGGAVYAKGSLKLDHATISDSTATGGFYARGGGVYAKGNLTMTDSTVSGNSAKSFGKARGGGAYAGSDLTATRSIVSNNSATSTGSNVFGGGANVRGSTNLQSSIISGNALTPGAGFSSIGAGAFAAGDFLAAYSTISDNRAYVSGFGGGLALEGASRTLMSSTISGNYSKGGFAGIFAFSGNPGTALVLTNATISDNHATTLTGGVYTNADTIKFYNSTIAFNSAGINRAGVALNAFSHAVAVTLQSTLISNNTFGVNDTENDLAVLGANTVTVNAGDLQAPANNLVRVSSIALPDDTRQDCPLLGPLRDNGGWTLTHALSSSSPAIDAGNAVSGVQYDQRGSQGMNGTIDYPRQSGNGALADIGAYEVQQDEIVFNSGFDGCAQ